MKDLAYLSWLVTECFCTDVVPLSGGRWAAVTRKLFTHAIIVGKMGDMHSIDEHWCFRTYAQAQRALADWTDRGAPLGSEPQGWFRHPVSGRRRDESGEASSEHFAP